MVTFFKIKLCKYYAFKIFSYFFDYVGKDPEYSENPEDKYTNGYIFEYSVDENYKNIVTNINDIFNNEIDIDHTGVADELGGQGLGKKLVQYKYA